MTADTARRSRRHKTAPPSSDGTSPMRADAPTTARSSGLHFTPFRTVPLGSGRELRLDTFEGPDGRFASARFFMRGGLGKPMEPGLPIHMSPPQIAAIVAALTEAADALQTLSA